MPTYWITTCLILWDRSTKSCNLEAIHELTWTSGKLSLGHPTWNGTFCHAAVEFFRPPCGETGAGPKKNSQTVVLGSQSHWRGLSLCQKAAIFSFLLFQLIFGICFFTIPFSLEADPKKSVNMWSLDGEPNSSSMAEALFLWQGGERCASRSSKTECGLIAVETVVFQMFPVQVFVLCFPWTLFVLVEFSRGCDVLNACSTLTIRNTLDAVRSYEDCHHAWARSRGVLGPLETCFGNWCLLLHWFATSMGRRLWNSFMIHTIRLCLVFSHKYLIPWKLNVISKETLIAG